MDDFFRALRAREFARLDQTGHVYLDHTGSALYPDSLVRAHAELLGRSVLGNPHSRNPSSRASTAIVDEARERTLAFFDADPDEYEAIFTPNATGALKIVGESYPFDARSTFRLTADDHNSVNGIREFALAHGADVRYVRIGADLTIRDLEAQLADGAPASGGRRLFAFPAQSNFSGVKHPLSFIERAHALGYQVLLDAAAYVPTSRLSLREVRPEFVAISFYKMFGFPTGIGALIARRSTLAELHRPWFGGGTVRFASAQQQVHIPYRDAAGFEDGTPNFLSIAAVAPGLDFLDAIGMERIQARIRALTARLLEELASLRHAGGARLVRVYGPAAVEGRGGTVAFNLVDPEGCVIDCRLVEQAAADANISLRTGYFCNPGAAEVALDLPEEAARACYGALAGDDFTLARFSACLGDRPVGAVRVSLGVSSDERDIARLGRLLATFRDVVKGGGSGTARSALGARRSATATAGGTTDGAGE